MNCMFKKVNAKSEGLNIKVTDAFNTPIVDGYYPMKKAKNVIEELREKFG